MSEAQHPSQAECAHCHAALVLIPATVFRSEPAAAELKLGTATDSNTSETVAHFTVVYADGHYVCPVCKTRQG
jgi:hypothetical protein